MALYQQYKEGVSFIKLKELLSAGSVTDPVTIIDSWC